jgi:hypothetical protein
MSEFVSACPKCRQRILCDTAFVGQRVACPVCLQEIIMPEAPQGNRTILPPQAQSLPPTSTSPVASSSSPAGQKQKFPMLAIAGAVVVLVLMLGVGIVVFMQQTKAVNNVPVVDNAPAANNAPSQAKPLAYGLVLWLDASTLQQPDQTSVDRLDDLSPSHNDAFINRRSPVFNAPNSPRALNGRGTIHFSSPGFPTNATGLKTALPLGITGSAPRSMFAVMRRDSGKSMRISTGNCGRAGEYYGMCDQNYGLWLPSGGAMRDNAFPQLTPAWRILSVICDGGTHKGFVNGSLKGMTNFPINTVDAEVELGLRFAQSGDSKRSSGSDGDFAELLIYNRALDASEQRQVEDYLNAKWFGIRPVTDRAD